MSAEDETPDAGGPGGPDQNELAARLVECEQQLAEMPELEVHLGLARSAEASLRADLESTKAKLDEVLESPSWRLTEPLRRARVAFKRLRTRR